MTRRADRKTPHLLVCRVGKTPNTFENALLARGIDFDFFEAIELIPQAPPQADLDLVQALPKDALLCFVSANAVRFALPYFEAIPRTTTVAAVGQKTASALKAAGFEEILTPLGHEDSEGLLEAIDASPKTFRWATIVKGVGGRETLLSGLEARGLTVRTLSFYRRHPVTDLPTGFLDTIWGGVCAMSNEVILATLNAFGPERRQALCSVPWLVTHERQAEFAKALGITRVFVCRPHESGELDRVMAQCAKNDDE